MIRTIRDCSIGADQIRVLATWDGPGHWKNAKLVADAARVIARVPKDTIAQFHISNGGAWLREGLLIRLARARGLRIVVSLHGYDFPEFAREHPRLTGTTLGKADHVICLSTEARDTVRDLLGIPNVTVLANPVAIDEDSPPANTTPPVALFAGTVGLRKGVDVLATAWQTLLDQGIEGSIRIVGEIDDFTPPMLERMSLEGPIHPNDVAALLREVRVIVLPSRAEGMPMILTEALAAGRPFVATGVGGTGDITPDQDMIVPVEDSDALAQAIGRYLRDATAAGDAGRRGQDYIIETRSPQVIDARLREIYASIQ